MSLTYNFQIIAIKNTTYPHCAQFILWKVWISRKKYCPDGVIIHSIGLSCICSLVDKTLPAGRNFTIFGKYIQKRTLTIRSVFTMSYKLFLVPILAVVLLLCSVLWQDQRGPDGTLAPPPPAPHEAAPITVRIGYLRPDPSVASSLDVRHFYGQHLTELAKYLDWTYELVEVPPQEGLNRLRQGDIDLLLPMEPNPARQEELSYTKHNFFLDTIALYTREGEKHYHPRDLSNLDGVSVGLYENRPINQNFQKFCKTFFLFGTLKPYFYGRRRNETAEHKNSYSADSDSDSVTDSDSAHHCDSVVSAAPSAVSVATGTRSASSLGFLLSIASEKETAKKRKTNTNVVLVSTLAE